MPAETLVVWMLLDRHRTGQVTAVGVATGIVVGLVAITPAAGFVPPAAALIIGGIAGALLTGVFASAAWGGTDGLLFGNPAQLKIQALGVLVALGWSAAVTFGLLKVIGAFVPLRVDRRSEGVGLDLSAHGEEAYAQGEGAILVHPGATARDGATLQPVAGGVR